jgi:hypothetical protein
MSEAHIGEKNHFLVRNTLNKHVTRQLICQKTKQRDQNGARNPFHGHHHTPETRERMSKSRADGLASGRIINTHEYGNKSWYVSSKTNERVRCDSILEKFRMTQLDNDPNVCDWTKRYGIKIPYVFNGYTKHYVPDFLITTNSGEKSLKKSRVMMRKLVRNSMFF